METKLTEADEYLLEEWGAYMEAGGICFSQIDQPGLLGTVIDRGGLYSDPTQARGIRAHERYQEVETTHRAILMSTPAQRRTVWTRYASPDRPKTWAGLGRVLGVSEKTCRRAVLAVADTRMRVSIAEAVGRLRAARREKSNWRYRRGRLTDPGPVLRGV